MKSIVVFDHEKCIELPPQTELSGLSEGAVTLPVDIEPQYYSTCGIKQLRIEADAGTVHLSGALSTTESHSKT